MLLNKKSRIAIGLIKSLDTGTETVYKVENASDLELYQTASKLVKSGILGSRRGRNGGYYITSDHITLADVLKATGEVKNDTVFDDLAVEALNSVVLSSGKAVK